jgi:hypothetical protein
MPPIDDANRCRFTFADGRACRMLRQHGHPSLCIFHARAERQLWESDRLGAELASSLTGNFMTATDVNFVLGKLFKAIAQNRIPPRNAANLAFVAKLLLNSLDKLKDEYRFKYEFQAWQNMERDAIALSDPPVPIPPGVPPGEKPLPASAQAFAAEILSTAPEVARNP